MLENFGKNIEIFTKFEKNVIKISKNSKKVEKITKIFEISNNLKIL